LQRANVRWELGETVRAALLDGARLLIDDLARAGISGFEPTAAVRDGDAAALVARDMAHSAGTTRMGRDPRDSVVDADCQSTALPGCSWRGPPSFPLSATPIRP
jgi:choline dehydrogenase-like flavoprotein